MANNEALKLAAKLNRGINVTSDVDVRCELGDLVCDLINHANGHATWLAQF